MSTTATTPPTSSSPRPDRAFNTRLAAANLSRSRPTPSQTANSDETLLRDPSTNQPTYLATFTKGLPHDPDTALLIDPTSFKQLVQAITSADPRDLRQIPLGPPQGTSYISGIARPGTTFPQQASIRGWVGTTAGSAFDLQGPDPQALSMPPAPPLHTPELALELTELYWMALLRDVPFTHFPTNDLVKLAVCSLVKTTPPPPPNRPRPLPYAPTNIFRGVTRGDLVGPYLSQFLLIGTTLPERTPQTSQTPSSALTNGLIQYGANTIDQRVPIAEPNRDYMTTFASYLDVQNAANVTSREVYRSTPPIRRFITTPRDLATYVHFDQLYQAYLNACLILLDLRVPFDPALPFQDPDTIDKQQPFVLFGPPHVLTLVTEVASRALKAVFFQKYNVHRRARPEQIAAFLDRFVAHPNEPAFEPLASLHKALDPELLRRISAENNRQNTTLSDNGNPRSDDLSSTLPTAQNLLLPMAFPEGSPMHPSYGAGHAAVAGACVTMLKAFFDSGYELPFAFAPNADGSALVPVALGDQKLTVEGELNKLCSNVSIGRNWAGVHYFSDYIDAIRLGEQVAIGILEEQKLTFGEEFSMSVPLFDGSVRRI